MTDSAANVRCWVCRTLYDLGTALSNAERVALGRIDATTVATVPVCGGCQALLRLPRLLAEMCGERNDQVAADLGIELVCRRQKHTAPPHRDGLWFWSTGTPESNGGWASITERDVREAMQ